MNAVAIVLLVLLGIFTQVAAQSARTFRGSSKNAYQLLLFTGNFGSLLFFIFIIWGFFVFPWWVPVISLIIPYALLHFSFRLSDNLFVRIVSPFLIVLLVIVLFVIYLR